MTPRPRIAGLSGILAGVGLAVGGALWATSGWTAETFVDGATALAFLQHNGAQLRAAVFAGAINLVLVTVFTVGLAARLGSTAPTRAAATLYFGIIGIAGHSLVPLGLWLGVPTFVDLAAGSAIISQPGWPVLLGWLGVLTGAASALTVLAAETPLAILAAGAYLPSLTLAVVFRIWAGIGLWKGDAQPVLEQGRPSDQTAAHSLGS